MDTVQYSLLAAIHNIFELGVEKAMEENRAAQYLKQVSASDEPVAVTEEAVEGIVGFQESVMADVNTRREAIKQDIIRLAKEYEQ